MNAAKQPDDHGLSATQADVLSALRNADLPLSAYDVLAILKRAQPTAAPPTAYRALNKLIALGLVHRLESRNAYVACDHPHHDGAPVFAICDDCGTVAEHVDPALVEGLNARSATAGFAPRSSVIEILGQCGSCRGAQDHT